MTRRSGDYLYSWDGLLFGDKQLRKSFLAKPSRPILRKIPLFLSKKYLTFLRKYGSITISIKSGRAVCAPATEPHKRPRCFPSKEGIRPSRGHKPTFSSFIQKLSRVSLRRGACIRPSGGDVSIHLDDFLRVHWARRSRRCVPSCIQRREIRPDP